MSQKLLFIDRDQTIIKEPADYQIDSFEKLQFLPNAITSLARIAAQTQYQLVMVTNQDGLGTSSFPEETFWGPQNLMMQVLQSVGAEFTEVCIDKSFEHENLATRKPGTAMLTHYIKGNYNLAESFVIGDRLTDMQLAQNLGAKCILLNTNLPEQPVALQTTNWVQIADFIIKQPRTASIARNTNETKIDIKLNLDGAGKENIKTGLPFFDHMLSQLAKHGNFDIDINVQGDLEVDEHHTIEDTAIALGEAFSQAVGNKKSMERYGFTLPMDDCLAQVAIDFGGRPWIVWDATFTREKIGDMPCEMFYHFFKSFSDTAKCNLNIKAEGQNEHHKIESIFKAWAKTIKAAVAKNNSGQIPSTKGIL
jgi:imidazoleglycerol-phosphate dehydratase / histidinol-phosphatase